MISIILVILAGIAKGVMDTVNFHWYDSVFKNMKQSKWKIWTNPTQSYALKWKAMTPESGERFIGSSTIFVWVTDLWHFMQMIELTTLFAAIVLYKPITNYPLLDFIILKCAFICAFMLFYRKLLYIRLRK